MCTSRDRRTVDLKGWGEVEPEVGVGSLVSQVLHGYSVRPSINLQGAPPLISVRRTSDQACCCY